MGAEAFLEAHVPTPAPVPRRTTPRRAPAPVHLALKVASAFYAFTGVVMAVIALSALQDGLGWSAWLPMVGAFYCAAFGVGVRLLRPTLQGARITAWHAAPFLLHAAAGTLGAGVLAADEIGPRALRGLVGDLGEVSLVASGTGFLLGWIPPLALRPTLEGTGPLLTAGALGPLLAFGLGGMLR